MLGNLLEKKLKDLKDRKIVVVMTDGIAFMGTLTDFDKTTIVIEDISQTHAADIDWEEIDVDKEGIDTGDVSGYINWTAVKLEEVYLQTEHISRIWPGHTFEKATTEYREPIYTRHASVYANRATGLDIPGGLR